jgi:hypothetical protein
LPDADSLVALGPEDLGMILLQLVQQERAPRVALSNLEMPLWNAHSPRYPQHKRMPVGRCIAEAWQWLQNEGLLMADLDQPNGWFCLTRKGSGLRSQADIEAYRHGNMLPAGLLSPILAEKVRPMFMRGDYEVAVIQAFKENWKLRFAGGRARRCARRRQFDARRLSPTNRRVDELSKHRGRAGSCLCPLFGSNWILSKPCSTSGCYAGPRDGGTHVGELPPRGGWLTTASFGQSLVDHWSKPT